MQIQDAKKSGGEVTITEEQIIEKIKSIKINAQ